jgi:exopolysaccharide biosynthesis polyprenyl glycosylphosphotransferase
MNAVRRRLLLGLVRLFDLGLQVLSFSLATLIVVSSDASITLRDFLAIRVSIANCVIFAFILYAWFLLFALCGLYQSRRLSEVQSEIPDVFKATALASLLLWLVAVLGRISFIRSWRFMIIFWAVSTALLVLSRLCLRSLQSSLRRRGRNLRHILVLGTNDRAIDFARKLKEQPERGYSLLGFMDAYWPRLPQFQKTGLAFLGDVSELPAYLRVSVVDEIAMFLPLRSFYEYASHVAGLCQQQGIILRFDPDIFGLKRARMNAEEFDGSYHICTEAHDGLGMFLKRCVDTLGALVALVALSPLFLIAAIAVKLTSDGPIFFRQERVGINKRKFHIYKFRTMISNAEALRSTLEQSNEMDGPVFKIKNDPRITPVGRLLRRTSIDELPQLFNVLIGDMSLVGPRPLPVRDFQGFSEDWQRRRFSVRPGITCLWQINGRNSITFEQWMKMDMQYLDEWSLWLDLKILARTIPAVLKGTGAT